MGASKWSDEQVLDVIEKMESPSWAEIGRALGITRASARERCLGLQERGLLEIQPQRIRVVSRGQHPG